MPWQEHAAGAETKDAPGPDTNAVGGDAGDALGAVGARDSETQGAKPRFRECTTAILVETAEGKCLLASRGKNATSLVDRSSEPNGDSRRRRRRLDETTTPQAGRSTHQANLSDRSIEVEGVVYRGAFVLTIDLISSKNRRVVLTS